MENSNKGESGKQLYNNIVFHSLKRIMMGKNAFFTTKKATSMKFFRVLSGISLFKKILALDFSDTRNIFQHDLFPATYNPRIQ